MLEGKVTIITGGTRGIGFETARLFLENKSNVIIFGSKEDSVNKAINELNSLGYNVEGYYPDLLNEEEINKVLKEIHNKYNHIDILINGSIISFGKSLTMSVLVIPGATAFTLMLYAPNSLARDLVIPFTANLLVGYPTPLGCP